MKLSELKSSLGSLNALELLIPGSQKVPSHFHITEAGLSTRHFIDCGGTIRKESSATFQVWVASDKDHRLTPQKLLKIIGSAAPLFGDTDPEVEIEYQSDTIGRYQLGMEGDHFLLLPMHTDCRAQDSCGTGKQKVSLSELSTSKQSCCTPGSGCCN